MKHCSPFVPIWILSQNFFFTNLSYFFKSLVQIRVKPQQIQADFYKILILSVSEYCDNLNIVTIQVTIQVTTWILTQLRFFNNLIFFTITFHNILIFFLPFGFFLQLEFLITWVLSQFVFCHNLTYVTIWLLS